MRSDPSVQAMKMEESCDWIASILDGQLERSSNESYALCTIDKISIPIRFAFPNSSEHDHERDA